MSRFSTIYMRRFFVFFASLTLLLSSFSTQVHAQFDPSIGVAYELAVEGEGVGDGDIVSFVDGQYTVSSSPYDPNAIGVVSLNPAIAFRADENGSAYPVVSFGNAFINVSGINGPIRKGDLVTTSSVPGVGMKATNSGYVIGSALEDFEPGNPEDVTKINVFLNVHYFFARPEVVRSVFDLLNLSAIATYEQPTIVFRYLLAGVIVLIAVILGFISFGRAANTGVEALGRNPLAGKMIQLGIFFNVLITVAIIVSGLAIAYIILRI